MDPEWKTKRAKYIAKKAGYASEAASGSAYQGGGTEGGLTAELGLAQIREEVRFYGLENLDQGEVEVVVDGVTGGLTELRGSELVDEDESSADEGEE